MSAEFSGKPVETAVTATVVEELANATWRVELEDRRQVLAHAAGNREANFVRVRLGDRVKLALSPLDPTRGRIVSRIV